MSRNFILASGVVCWTVVAVDVLVHLLDGNLFVPSGMAAVFVVWVGLRRVQLRRARMIPVVADRA
jgi:hypothetical protein